MRRGMRTGRTLRGGRDSSSGEIRQTHGDREGEDFRERGGILTPMNGRVESADGKLTQMWMRMTEVGVKSGVTLMAGETNLRGSEKCFCTHGRESWS